MSFKKTIITKTVDIKGLTAVDFLAEHSGLPKARIKDAMTKGAVTVKTGKRTKRLRRAKATLNRGDTVALHYDEALLKIEPTPPRLIADEKHYSVWYKPVGVLSQGNQFGDHCALLRMVEQQLNRPVYLVHRLDREAHGLMIIAHSAKAAAELSRCFQSHRIDKSYRIEVLGVLPEQGEFSSPIDGKPAISRFVRTTLKETTSIAEVSILQGRKHQIRRHFSKHGYPVMGDPRYGKGNKDSRGMQLCAYRLAFKCPISHRLCQYALSPDQPF